MIVLPARFSHELVWPPHQYIRIFKVLLKFQRTLSELTIKCPHCPRNPRTYQSTYDIVLCGQLRFTETQLPGQLPSLKSATSCAPSEARALGPFYLINLRC